jgi:hypothetical protein
MLYPARILRSRCQKHARTHTRKVDDGPDPT